MDKVKEKPEITKKFNDDSPNMEEKRKTFEKKKKLKISCQQSE
jgi:hypothetical protein